MQQRLKVILMLHPLAQGIADEANTIALPKLEGLGVSDLRCECCKSYEQKENLRTKQQMRSTLSHHFHQENCVP